MHFSEKLVWWRRKGGRTIYLKPVHTDPFQFKERGTIIDLLRYSYRPVLPSFAQEKNNALQPVSIVLIRSGSLRSDRSHAG